MIRQSRMDAVPPGNSAPCASAPAGIKVGGDSIDFRIAQWPDKPFLVGAPCVETDLAVS